MITKTKLLALAGIALGLMSSASAHIVFAESEAAPDSYYAGFLRVSHGCGSSPTRSIRVEIPDGVNLARPQPKPGWTITIEHAPLSAPIPSEGGAITERVTAITWSGELPADQFDQFGLLLRLPSRAGPLYFPVTQTCAEGAQHWTEIPAQGAAWRSVPHPAPVLNLVDPNAASPAHSGHH
jgi:hypothetical protein